MTRALSQDFKINRHFQRSKRLDRDLGPEGLEGYRLNETAWHILESFAEDVASGRQRAFTWTGPYGSGKSSLALLLSALLAPKGKVNRAAARILGKERVKIVRRRLKASEKGWVVARIVGRRESPLRAIWLGLQEAVQDRFGEEVVAKLFAHVTDEPSLSALTSAIEAVADLAAQNGDGLLILVDEMGKFLEFAASEDGDLYVFQELAEVISRIKAPCAFLGVLHQAFDEYGRRSSRSARTEWAKVQGRFSDVPFSIAIEEVVGLIGDAIEGDKSNYPTGGSEIVATAIAGGRFGKVEALVRVLSACAPLHPVTALILGPISRRRFGQNERSVFSFLSSREPGSFGEFLDDQSAGSLTLYSPSRLWDYLQLNHEPTILASPDGPRWSEAAEALVRAQRRVDSQPEHIALFKTIAVLDLFGRPFGLGASDALLSSVFSENLPTLLDELRGWSLIVGRRHAGGWSVFAGSDIEIEAEAEKAAVQLSGDLDRVLAHLGHLPPVVAKRHYAEKGTLRIFERLIVPAAKFKETIKQIKHTAGQSGRFVLVVASELEQSELQIELNEMVGEIPAVVSILPSTGPVVEAAIHLAALESLPVLIPQLYGDAAARRELAARCSAARNEVGEMLRQAFADACWQSLHRDVVPYEGAGLSEIATQVCEATFSEAPRIINELLNRQRPASAVVAARRRLLQLMVQNGDQYRLGIEKEPAELGIYLSLLRLPGIHVSEDANKWKFVRPTDSSFGAMWDAALQLLRETPEVLPIHDVYALWQRSPFGLRAGVQPVFLLALILANAEKLALYIDGNFIPRFDEVIVDRLVQSADDVGLRWIDAGVCGGNVVQRAAEFVAQMGKGDVGLTALEVTKPLVHFAKQLPGWTRRTRTISPLAQEIRDVLLDTKDPYGLLFHDLPKILGSSGTNADQTLDFVALQRVMDELASAQANLEARLEKLLSRALGTRLDTASGRKRIAIRAEIVAGSAQADFRTRRFAQSLALINDDRLEAIGAILTLAVGRPLRDWADADIGRGTLELNNLAVQFGQIEASVLAASPEASMVREVAARLLKDVQANGLAINEQRAALLQALNNLPIDDNVEEAA